MLECGRIVSVEGRVRTALAGAALLVLAISPGAAAADRVVLGEEFSSTG
jgi:hypothetical protein